MVATSLVTGPGAPGERAAAADADSILHAAPSASTALSSAPKPQSALAVIDDYDSHLIGQYAPGNMLAIADDSPEDAGATCSLAVFAASASSVPALLESVRRGAAAAQLSDEEQSTTASSPPARPISPPTSRRSSGAPASHHPLYPQQPLRPFVLCVLSAVLTAHIHGPSAGGYPCPCYMQHGSHP